MTAPADVFGYFLKIEPPVAGNLRVKSFALFLFAGLVGWVVFRRHAPDLSEEL